MQTWSTHHGQSLPIGFSVIYQHFTQMILLPVAGLQPQLKGHEAHLKSLILH